MSTAPDLSKPITREEVEALTDWTRYPLDSVPVEQRPTVLTYEHAIVGIEDCFDSLDGAAIRSCSQYAAKDRPWTTPKDEADTFITGHLAMLDTWHDALDGLDSDLRGDVVAGGLPDWAHALLKHEARGLFLATTTLLRAIAEYHHGSAGPGLSEAYGFAYALSNSTLNPFN